MLLDPPNWLNDKLIAFYFEYLEHQLKNEGHNNVSLISPDVTQFIKLCEGDELRMFLEPLKLQSKDIIIMTINDNSSLTTAGGSHWSTLIYDRKSNTFMHFDSSASNSNMNPAEICSRRLSYALQIEGASFENKSCPSQQNSYDCGVYAVMFGQYYIECRLKNLSVSINDYINEETVTKWRTNTKILISKLSEC
jgi:sentrin-specific protease 8